MARLPLEQLEAFVCAARLGNLTRAAESMNLTVSALSHRMRLLEERVGQVLLRRGPRGVVPTVAGQRLLDEVGEPLDRIAQALRRCSAVPGNAVTLSLTPSLANAWLVPRLPQLVAAHP
ncbi:LysR family transcriptional regulator [Stenotrophomonas sp. Marseille-Q4652]|uniref:LysR family transcriptional regulator n=1 Tax=Stenotrophomonas sp. Marseille-Q4652 TaxID=2866595 RepID=UPI001CE4ACFA|nr:LysR family transcriptional regulator [Stenotrophomonas sp. Marseille-Q4652]